MEDRSGDVQPIQLHIFCNYLGRTTDILKLVLP